MTDPIDQIIAGMSEAQKLAVRNASPARSNFRVLVLPLYSDRGAMSRSLVNLGLAGFSSYGAALVKKGKAVRDALRERG